MIEVTVALPLFNARDIAWLCLESFCRQENVNFQWELIVIEEQYGNYFGHRRLNQFRDRLKAAGCARITYVPLDKWMPLGQKWKTAVDHSSETSECYIWSAADCYSEPRRFAKAYKYINVEKYDWVCDKLGLFYNIPTGETILYADRDNQQRAGLASSTKMSLMRLLPDNDFARKVDGFVFNAIKPQTIKNIFDEDGRNDWKGGLNTDGHNNISLNRKKYYKRIKFPFEPTPEKIDNLLPEDIVAALKKMMQ